PGWVLSGRYGPSNALPRERGLVGWRRRDSGNGQHRACGIERDPEPRQQRRQHDVRLRHGECCADADARAGAKWQEGTASSPRRKLARETVRRECRRTVPVLAVTVQHPRADPGLRPTLTGSPATTSSAVASREMYAAGG